MTRGQLRHAERLWSDGYAGCRLPVKREMNRYRVVTFHPSGVTCWFTVVAPRRAEAMRRVIRGLSRGKYIKAMSRANTELSQERLPPLRRGHRCGIDGRDGGAA